MNWHQLVHHVGWMVCEQETLFGCILVPIADHSGHLLLTINHPPASTHSVATKCPPPPSYLPTYIRTTNMPYLLTIDI
jgi:hypothetical protein